MREGEEIDALLQEVVRINNGSFLEQLNGTVTIPMIATQVENKRAIQANAAQTLEALNQLMRSRGKTSIEIPGSKATDCIVTKGDIPNTQ